MLLGRVVDRLGNILPDAWVAANPHCFPWIGSGLVQRTILAASKFWNGRQPCRNMGQDLPRDVPALGPYHRLRPAG